MMSKSRGIKALRHRGIECDERSLTLVASHRPARHIASHRASRGFTLIELMIAIAVLLVVIAATAHIFGTASKVTGTGHAAASVLQEAAVIERMIRDDIARMSPEGFFAIRQVAVPNDVNVGQPGGRLLNPMLREDAWIRADQLVFFADGVAGMQTFDMGLAGGGTANQSQGVSARVYYGHGFQLPAATGFIQIPNVNDGHAHDPAEDVLPWHNSDVAMLRTRFTTNEAAGGPTGTGVFQQLPANAAQPSPINGRQPEARQWLLARQAVALAAKDQEAPNTNAKTVYLNNRIARSIFRTNPAGVHPVFGWTNEIRNGRMDGAASRPDAIQRYLQIVPNTNPPQRRPWEVQRDIISAQLLYYPRAERHAPGPHRVDQALTNHVIGTAVSSFIVEWTYADGTGDMYAEDGKLICQFVNGDVLPCDTDNDVDRERFGFYTNFYGGSGFQFQPEQPWFGLNLPDRGVGGYGDWGANGYHQRANFKPAGASGRPGGTNWASVIFPDNIERWWTGQSYGPPFGDYPNIEIYEAIFGYNRNTPSAPNPASNPPWIDEPHPELAYTPWPTAIRVTMVLHDPQGRLEHGREFQFVIDLPKRVRK